MSILKPLFCASNAICCCHSISQQKLVPAVRTISNLSERIEKKDQSTYTLLKDPNFEMILNCEGLHACALNVILGLMYFSNVWHFHKSLVSRRD